MLTFYGKINNSSQSNSKKEEQREGIGTNRYSIYYTSSTIRTVMLLIKRKTSGVYQKIQKYAPISVGI